MAACGHARPAKSVGVRINVPTPPGSGSAFATLQPPPTPTPSPVPTPTPPPLEPPSRADIRAASGTQQGAPASFCWVYEGGRTTCREYPPPSQPQALVVGRSENVVVRIETTRVPTDQTVRPFQGRREDYPETKLVPGAEIQVKFDLDPGTWDVDLCARWRGHGDKVCWLFKVEVGGLGE